MEKQNRKINRVMKKFLTFFFLIMIPLSAGYIYYFYFNVVEDGQREGKLYNFSKAKGDIVKTAEGIMIQPGLRSRGTGLNTNEFHFSVRDKSISDSLSNCIGSTIVVRYIKYRRTLFWRGENNDEDNKETGQFIVTELVKVIDEGKSYQEDPLIY